MPSGRPLHPTPEFMIYRHPGWTEYRVEAGRPDNVGSRLKGFGADGVVALAISYYWNTITSARLHAATAAVLLLFYLYSRLNRLLWESVVVIPSLGLQLETHRGYSGFPLFVSRRFMPWSSLEDFLINEGIRGWDVRYYLVAINRTQHGALKLEVAFENLLPRFPVLLQVYHGVQEALNEEHAERRIHSTRSISTDSDDGDNK
ncbi:hypothetical protein C8Q78DRAFT_970666 [Trametes maxima]|nr:hypothetical protein C8Q78DRAFT_970666 [Trametes maxima]